MTNSIEIKALLDMVKDDIKLVKKDKPFWEKECLSVEEAAAYSGIGRNKLRNLLKQKNCPFAVPSGNQLCINKEKLNSYTNARYRI